MPIPEKRQSQTKHRVEAILDYVATFRPEASDAGQYLTYRSLMAWTMSRFGIASSTARRYIEMAREQEKARQPAREGQPGSV